MAGSVRGRVRERRALSRFIDAVDSGAGGLVALVGDAGIGKTTLLRWLADRAGARVAWVTCREGGLTPPFWPWARLLRDLDIEAPRTWLAGVHDHRSDRRAARVRQFDAVLAGLAAHADRTPLLLVVDDAQWLDPASAELMSFALPELAGSGIGLALALRSGVVTGLDPVMRDVARHGLVLTLGPLSVEDLGAVLADALGAEVDGARTTALHGASQGNPFFAVQLARSGAPVPLTPVGGDPVLPTAVRAALLERVSGLDPSVRRVLEVLAVAGADARTLVLADVLGMSADEVLVALGAAEGEGLVALGHGGMHSFTHPLMASALTDSLDLPRRTTLHRLVAAALTALDDGVPASHLVPHLVSAVPAGAAADAVRTCARAGTDAMSVLAYEDAAAYFGEAAALLPLAPQAGDAARLLLLEGDALTAAGRAAQARAAYMSAADAARQSADPASLARAALAVGAGDGFEITADEEQAALLAEALAAVGDRAPGLRARLLARRSVVAWATDPVPRRVASAEEAVRLGRAAADEAALVDALGALADALAGPAELVRRRGVIDEMLRAAETAGDLPRALLARRMRVVARMEVGDLESAREEVADFELTALRLRRPLYSWYVPLWRACLRWAADDRASAEALLGTAAATGAEAGSGNAALLCLMSRVFADLDDGRPADPAPALEMLASGDATVQVWASVSLAYTAVGTGDIEAARAHLAPAAPGLPHVPQDSEYLPMLVQAATVCAATGDDHLGAWVYDALHPYGHLMAVEGIGAYCHGSTHRHLGLLAALLGRDGDSAAHLAAARTVHAAPGAERLARLTERAISATGVDLSSTPALPARAPSGARHGVFRRVGDVWSVGLDGGTAAVRDSKGMRDIAVLLAAAGREVPAVELARGAAVAVEQGGLGAVVDDTARTAYRRRLADLDEESARADAAGDAERGERVEAERAALLAQLRSAYGLGGRPRIAGDTGERARTTVTARIRDAVRRIAVVDPPLGTHLRHCLRTGRMCRYEPEGPVEWDVSTGRLTS